MQHPSVDEILISWLTASVTSGATLIASHDIEASPCEYARARFGVSYLGGTYSRAWRRLRETGALQNIFVIEDIPELSKQKKEKVWAVKLVTLG
jgi:ABC-type lipopolysaccharide export system ATPase subunit